MNSNWKSKKFDILIFVKKWRKKWQTNVILNRDWQLTDEMEYIPDTKKMHDFQVKDKKSVWKKIKASFIRENNEC